MDTESHIYICIHSYVHVATVVQEEETMDLRVSKYWGPGGGGRDKRKGEMM